MHRPHLLPRVLLSGSRCAPPLAAVLLTTIALLSFATRPAQGGFVEVCPDLSGPCLYTSIAAALSVSNPNDIISVRSGVYNETDPATVTYPLTMAFGPQVRINATAATSPWLTVNSNLTLNIDDVLTLDDAAIFITSTGWLEQNGDLDLRVRNATFLDAATAIYYAGAVRLSGGTWTQNGAVAIDVAYTSLLALFAFGVQHQGVAGDPSQWTQNGTLSIAIDSDAPTCSGVDVSGSAAKWSQLGPVQITARCRAPDASGVVAGVAISAGWWDQAGTVVISVTGANTTNGVRVGAGGEWTQSAPAQIRIDSPFANGVHLAKDGVAGGSQWIQDSPISLTLVQQRNQTGFRCTDDSTWTCRTANLTQFLGGFRFVAQEVPSCGWKLGYVPQLPPDFFVSCNPDFIPTNILLPRSVLQLTTGTCNATEVQTVGLQDNSPQTWVKGFAYTLTATSDHSTGEFRVPTTGLSSFTPAFDLVNGTATATFRLGDGDLAGQTGALVLLPAPGAFALSPKYLLPVTFADSGLLSSDNTIHDGIKLPLALDFNNTGELSVSISPRDKATGKVDRGNALRLSSFIIEEINNLDETVRTVQVPTGNWTFTQAPERDIQSLLTFEFATPLFPPEPNVTTPTFGMRWYLFDSTTNVTLPAAISDLPLTASPQFAKMTLTLDAGWPWLASDNTLRLRVGLQPAGFKVVSITRRSLSAALAIITYAIQFGQADQAAELRLLSAGVAVGQQGAGDRRVNVTHALNRTQSELVLSFEHFEGPFLYDPDFSVIAGAKAGESSDDNSAVVIAVAVVVPVAVVLVLLVIVGAVVAGVVAKRRRGANLEHAINFGGDAHSVGDQAL